MSVHNSFCRKKPKHSKAQSTMPTSRDVRDKPWRPLFWLSYISRLQWNLPERNVKSLFCTQAVNDCTFHLVGTLNIHIYYFNYDYNRQLQSQQITSLSTFISGCVQTLESILNDRILAFSIVRWIPVTSIWRHVKLKLHHLNQYYAKLESIQDSANPHKEQKNYHQKFRVHLVYKKNYNAKCACLDVWLLCIRLYSFTIVQRNIYPSADRLAGTIF